MNRKDFMGNHEWCFYGWREGAAHRFFGGSGSTRIAAEQTGRKADSEPASVD